MLWMYLGKRWRYKFEYFLIGNKRIVGAYKVELGLKVWTLTSSREFLLPLWIWMVVFDVMARTFFSTTWLLIKYLHLNDWTRVVTWLPGVAMKAFIQLPSGQNLVDNKNLKLFNNIWADAIKFSICQPALFVGTDMLNSCNAYTCVETMFLRSVHASQGHIRQFSFGSRRRTSSWSIPSGEPLLASRNPPSGNV